mmetsp:Transcript_12924/g.35706  ORF Transcript_12924/g.35706 Transcript_12924/m.35706 type:complete len:206 (-) Transcript_12924:714-1331(-)
MTLGGGQELAASRCTPCLEPNPRQKMASPIQTRIPAMIQVTIPANRVILWPVRSRRRLPRTSPSAKSPQTLAKRAPSTRSEAFLMMVAEVQRRRHVLCRRRSKTSHLSSCRPHSASSPPTDCHCCCKLFHTSVQQIKRGSLLLSFTRCRQMNGDPSRRKQSGICWKRRAESRSDLFQHQLLRPLLHRMPRSPSSWWRTASTARPN